MIRIDAVWLAVAPLDMRAGLGNALARVVTVFGSAQSYAQRNVSRMTRQNTYHTCSMEPELGLFN